MMEPASAPLGNERSLLSSQLTSFASFLWEFASLGPNTLGVMPLDAWCLTWEHVPLIFHWLPHGRWEHDRNKHLRFTVQRVQLWIIVGRLCGTHSIMLKSTPTACLQDFWAQEVQKLNQNHYFIRRGEETPPSYPNKDLPWILDVSSVLKWSTSARFGSFSRARNSAQLQRELDLHPSPFCLAHWLQNPQLLACSCCRMEDNSWCYHDVIPE